MASSKEYLQFILEQLSDLEEINYRAMMGEFIIYYRGMIVGGIYDDRLLVKPTKSAVSYMASRIYHKAAGTRRERQNDRYRVHHLRTAAAAGIGLPGIGKTNSG